MQCEIFALGTISGDELVERRLIELLADDSENVRTTAVAMLSRANATPAVRERIFGLLDDASENVRLSVMGTLPMLLSQDAASHPAEANLFVLPDPQARDDALEVLAKVERAAKTLDDLSQEDAEHRIINELILPGLSDLKQLLTAGASDVERAKQQRKRSAFRIQVVIGYARALAHIVPVVAAAGPAADSVMRAAEAMEPIADTLIHLAS